MTKTELMFPLKFVYLSLMSFIALYAHLPTNQIKNEITFNSSLFPALLFAHQENFIT